MSKVKIKNPIKGVIPPPKERITLPPNKTHKNKTDYDRKRDQKIDKGDEHED